MSYRGQSHSFGLAPSSTLETLHDTITEKTGVLPTHQKIVAPGPLKKAFSGQQTDDEATLSQLGFDVAVRRGPIKLMLVGPKQEEIEAVRREDELGAKFKRPRQYHPSMLRGGRVSAMQQGRMMNVNGANRWLVCLTSPEVQLLQHQQIHSIHCECMP